MRLFELKRSSVPAEAEGHIRGDGGHDHLVVRVLKHEAHRRLCAHLPALHNPQS